MYCLVLFYWRFFKSWLKCFDVRFVICFKSIFSFIMPAACVFRHGWHCLHWLQVRLFSQWNNKIKLNKGSQVGVVVITRASHFYDPGSTPAVRMWAEIYSSLSDSEGFSPCTPVFLPPWGCAPRSFMVRIAAARGAYICFRSDLVELRCLCTLTRWWVRVFLLFFFSFWLGKVWCKQSVRGRGFAWADNLFAQYLSSLLTLNL